MQSISQLNLWSIIKKFKRNIAITWGLVAVENIMTVMIPLFIGFTIDSLLNKQFNDLIILAAIIFLLIVISVIRRVYDTRAYGKIRVALGGEVDRRLRSNPVATRNARLDMSRELVDFLEQDVPELFTAIIQLFASIIVLASFSFNLALSPLIAGLVMIILYSCFHHRFITLNANLNTQMEKQVSILSTGTYKRIKLHLQKLAKQEIKISDTEAIVYGLIFLVLFMFVLSNLVLATQLENITSGTIFSIMSYSMEFMGAAIMLPMALQSLSRLTEITQRINQPIQDGNNEVINE
ncbi:MAG: ABC transporter six-transmembrane domain-containing protein [Parashewanella sp.]